MINRALLRIKVIQTLYSYYKGGGQSPFAAQKELAFSLEKTYDLYFHLLQLSVEVTRYAANRIETRRNKLRPTDEDLRPNMRFVENAFIRQLADNEQLAGRLAERKLSWMNYPDLMKSLYEQIEATDFFLEYMQADGTDYEAQEASIAQASDFDNAVTYARQAINGELPALSIEEAFDVNNEENDELFWSVQYSSSAVENPVDDGSYQQSQFGAYQGGSEKPRNKAIDGNFAPSLRLQQMYTRGDGRLEQTFMLEFHEAYFDWYTNPTSKILYYYAPAWATDEDIAAWRADDPNGIKTETIVSKTVAEGGIAPSNGQPASYKDRRTQDFGNAAIKKFDDYTETSIANRSTTCSMHDVVLARLGEAYLIAAEAYYKKGDMQQAAEMINNLRQRPGTIKSGYETAMHVDAADITIDFILDERARELAGEYVRWTDLKRTHKLIEYVTEYNEDGVELSALTGPDGKYKILRPIPQAAIDLNQAHVEQNPGY